MWQLSTVPTFQRCLLPLAGYLLRNRSLMFALDGWLMALSASHGTFVGSLEINRTGFSCGYKRLLGLVFAWLLRCLSLPLARRWTHLRQISGPWCNFSHSIRHGSSPLLSTLSRIKWGSKCFLRQVGNMPLHQPCCRAHSIFQKQPRCGGLIPISAGPVIPGCPHNWLDSFNPVAF